MILVDTAPLVALCDSRDALHGRAVSDLDRVARRPLLACEPVLAEACFLLTHRVQRQRLDRLLVDLEVRPFALADGGRAWTEVFRWLDKYADHEPDWADAYLAVASQHHRRAKVWTYGREFRTTWRRLDGTSIPLRCDEAERHRNQRSSAALAAPGKQLARAGSRSGRCSAMNARRNGGPLTIAWPTARPCAP